MLYVTVSVHQKIVEHFRMKSIPVFFLLFICQHACSADYSGTYDCTLYDQTEGYFTGEMVLELNKSASIAQQGFNSYDFHLSYKGVPYQYEGYAAANGNQLALYFESVGSQRDPDDKAVGIANVVVEKDVNNKDIVRIHKFYYMQDYHDNSNTGFESCVRRDATTVGNLDKTANNYLQYLLRSWQF